GYRASIAQPTDTVALIFTVLSPDTTAPRVANARAVDSLHVRVEVDDYFDPAGGLAGARAEVLALPDSTPFALGQEFFAEPVFTAAEQARVRQRALEAARLADTAAAADTLVDVPVDTIAADTLAVSTDDVAAPDVTLPV